MISLASTLLGAGLFLECLAEPGTVVSVGILMPSCFGKSRLFRGRGWIFFFFFFFALRVGLSHYLWVKVEFLEVLAFS